MIFVELRDLILDYFTTFTGRYIYFNFFGSPEVVSSSLLQLTDKVTFKLIYFLVLYSPSPRQVN